MNSETVRVFLSYGFAFFVVGLCFWFLNAAFLDPAKAALPQDQQTAIVAGIFGILGGATTFVFGQAMASTAARQSERANRAGADAALATPQTPLSEPGSRPE